MYQQSFWSHREHTGLGTTSVSRSVVIIHTVVVGDCRYLTHTTRPNNLRCFLVFQIHFCCVSSLGVLLCEFWCRFCHHTDSPEAFGLHTGQLLFISRLVMFHMCPIKVGEYFTFHICSPFRSPCRDRLSLSVFFSVHHWKKTTLHLLPFNVVEGYNMKTSKWALNTLTGTVKS